MRHYGQIGYYSADCRPPMPYRFRLAIDALALALLAASRAI